MPSGSVKILTQGQTLVVDLLGPAGASVSAWSDAALTSTLSLPATISSDTTIYVRPGNDLTLSIKKNDLEIASEVGTTRLFRPQDGQQLVISPTVNPGVEAHAQDFVTSAVATATFATVVNVRGVAYGAVGDGVTDDQPAFSAAIAAAVAAGGGTVFVPEGDYLLTGGSVSIPTGVSLQGVGARSILRKATSSGQVHVNIPSSATDITVQGIACVGPGDQVVASENLEPTAILLNGSNSRVKVLDCFIKDIAGFGVGVGSGCADILVRGNHIDGTGNTGLADGHAITVETSHRVVISDNIVSNTRYRGVEIFSGFAGGTENVVVSGNSFYNTHATAIAVFASSNDVGHVRNVTVTGNTIDTTVSTTIGVGAGIYVGHLTSGVTVTGNTIQDTASDGIIVTESTAQTTPYLCTVSGNTIRNAGRHGIYTDGPRATVGVSGNVVTGSWLSGIYLDGAIHAAVSDNLCLDNGRQASGGTDYAGIWGNTATYCTVTGNVCRDTRAGVSRTQTVGIYLTNSSDYNSVHGNIVVNNVNGQVLLTGTNNTTLRAYAERQQYTAGSNINLSSSSYSALGFTDITIPAVAGDMIEVGAGFRLDAGAGVFFGDVATIVSGSVVSYASGLGAGSNGIAGWLRLPGAAGYVSGGVLFPVSSGDISGGTVTLRLLAKTDGAARAVVAGGGEYPTFHAINHGPIAA